MQRGDIELDRWAYLVAITLDSRGAYVLAWAASEDPGAAIEDVQLETDARVQFWIAELSLRVENQGLFVRSMLLADRPWTRHWVVHWLILLLIVALSIA